MSEPEIASTKRMVTFRGARSMCDAAVLANVVKQCDGEVFSITTATNHIVVWFRVDDFDHANRIDHEIGKMSI